MKASLHSALGQIVEHTGLSAQEARGGAREPVAHGLSACQHPAPGGYSHPHSHHGAGGGHAGLGAAYAGYSGDETSCGLMARGRPMTAKKPSTPSTWTDPDDAPKLTEAFFKTAARYDGATLKLSEQNRL